MPTEIILVKCHYCGLKNRVPSEADRNSVICGACRSMVFGPHKYFVLGCKTIGLATHQAQLKIVQLAWSIYTEDGGFLDEHMHIIRPEGYSIPSAAAQSHGITNALAMERGEDKKSVLLRFMGSVKSHRVRFVAHDLPFTGAAVTAGLKSIGEQFNMDDFASFCTMLATTQLCGIPGRFGKPRWPTLQELHQYLFDGAFEGGHDALADVKATAACFFYLKEKQLLPVH